MWASWAAGSLLALPEGSSWRRWGKASLSVLLLEAAALALKAAAASAEGRKPARPLLAALPNWMRDLQLA